MSISLNPVFSFPKFLDQPLLLEKMQAKIPVLLPLAGLGYAAYDTYQAPPSERKKTLVKSLSVLAFTIAGALWAQKRFMSSDVHELKEAAEATLSYFEKNRGAISQKASEFLGRIRKAVALPEKVSAKTLENLLPDEAALRYLNAESIRRTLKADGKAISAELSSLLEKAAGDRILTPSEAHRLRKALHGLYPKDAADKIFNRLVPDPHAHSAKEILGEIYKLSALGFFPVVGGILGGVVGNLLNRDHWREQFKNQAKEGFFQYFANIMLCNVGAGVFLLLLEKLGGKTLAKSRAARAVAMMIGIAAFGVLGGSAIANFIGKNCFNPLLDHGLVGGWHEVRDRIRQHGWRGLFDNLWDERRPEALDVGLHVDDVATVGVLSGLGWIEPILPFLYSISGYRAGTGYRNGETARHASAQPKSVVPASGPLIRRSQPVFSQATGTFSWPAPVVSPRRVQNLLPAGGG